MAIHEFNSNGKKSSVWSAEDAGVDAGKKKYISSCDEHDTFVSSSSLKDAIRNANSTHEFCDGCREDLHKKA